MEVKMNPNKYFLERKQNKEIDKILNQMGTLVDEVVNFGTHIMEMCQKEEPFTEVEAPIITTFTQFLTMIDSVSIVIRKGTSDGVKPLLRSALETKLNLEYFVKEEPKKGLLPYQVVHIRNEIDELKKRNEYTIEGKDFRKKLNGRKLNSYDTRNDIKMLEETLNTPLFKEVNQEWLRLKKLKGRKPYWHSLFNGPASVEQLATYLGQSFYYQIIYKDTSSLIHGGASMKRLQQKQNYFAINPGIRRLEEIPTLFNYTVTFAIEVYRVLLKKYNSVSFNEMDIWYSRTIYKEYKKLSSQKFDIKHVMPNNIV